MSFDPEKFRLSWAGLIAFVSQITMGIVILGHEVITRSYNPGAMAWGAALLGTGSVTVGLDRAGKR